MALGFMHGMQKYGSSHVEMLDVMISATKDDRKYFEVHCAKLLEELSTFLAAHKDEYELAVVSLDMKAQKQTAGLCVGRGQCREGAVWRLGSWLPRAPPSRRPPSRRPPSRCPPARARPRAAPPRAPPSRRPPSCHTGWCSCPPPSPRAGVASSKDQCDISCNNCPKWIARMLDEKDRPVSVARGAWLSALVLPPPRVSCVAAATSAPVYIIHR